MIDEIKEKILDEIRYGELNNDNGLLPTWLNKPEIPHHAECMKCFQDGVSCKRYTDAVIVKNIFKELEKVDVPDTNVGEWIPCSERLPEEGAVVLVSLEEDEDWSWVRLVREGYYDEGYWFDMDGAHYGLEILAWMPLPQPYVEGDKE